MLKTAIILAVAAVLTTPAGLAHADDQSYLANLSAHGIFTFINPDGLIAAGNAICDDLRRGVSIPDEIGKFQAMHYQAKPAGAAAMVNAAHDELCQDTPS